MRRRIGMVVSLAIATACTASGSDPEGSTTITQPTTASDTVVTATTGIVTSGSDADGSTAASTEPASGDSGADTAPGSTSGDGFPAEMCGDLRDEAACLVHQLPCRWIDVIEVSRERDACELEESGRCVGYSEGGGGGCETTTSCPLGSTPFIPPFYRVEKSGAFVIGSSCNTSPPLGWTWCNTGEAATADPPECACACELYPGFEGASTGA